MTTNFGNVSKDYAKYRDRLPEILFEQLQAKDVQFGNKDVVELGSGSGIFSRDLVKLGARVIGIEPSQELIKEAEVLDEEENIKSITYIRAQAEDFNIEGKYKLFCVVRAWHWFDRIKAIQNIKTKMQPEAELVVINSIFLPNSKVAQETFEVLTNNHIELKPAGSNAEVKERRNGFPINWFQEWKNNSLQLIDEWQHDYNLIFTPEEWCGKIRSISWLTNESEETKNRITNELMKKFESTVHQLIIPHRYSVVILRLV
ncbi:class I SAM-dependent methyltransferase [Cohnella lupini]|uniref:Methyltransferase family protein n=1 Tax=Cohnella lupini TaxID=1294267 RepID=A0A3D9IYG7_9BACL|nr:class I SAM-dependent methyltransferase [Cohnella lupini]RED66126.1 methyltransferase family protein [Cohnella lupini]